MWVGFFRINILLYFEMLSKMYLKKQIFEGKSKQQKFFDFVILILIFQHFVNDRIVTIMMCETSFFMVGAV